MKNAFNLLGEWNRKLFLCIIFFRTVDEHKQEQEKVSVIYKCMCLWDMNIFLHEKQQEIKLNQNE